MHDHPVISLVAQPLNVEHYDSLRSMAAEIHVYAPDARVLTTYYCGANLPSLSCICTCFMFLFVFLASLWFFFFAINWRGMREGKLQFAALGLELGYLERKSFR